MLHCAAVCCSVLQCVACGAVCCRVLQQRVRYELRTLGIACRCHTCCSVLQCLLQCVLQWCGTCLTNGYTIITRLLATDADPLQCVLQCLLQCLLLYDYHVSVSHVLRGVAVCCSMMQYDGVCWSVLQRAAVCWSVLQCAALCCSV